MLILKTLQNKFQVFLSDSSPVSKFGFYFYSPNLFTFKIYIFISLNRSYFYNIVLYFLGGINIFQEFYIVS